MRRVDMATGMGFPMGMGIRLQFGNENLLKQNIIAIKKYVLLSCHLGWMNRRRFCLQKGGRQEHISLSTILFCFNEFAFTIQVKHKINSIQILDFILICLYFTTGHFHTCTLQSM